MKLDPIRASGIRLVSIFALVVSFSLPGRAAATATSVVVGEKHVCVLDGSGGVKCWGGNQYGQVGDGTTVDRTTPVAVVGLTSGVLGISTRGNHTCVLTAAGGVKCWGKNGAGQLGDGTTTNQSAPVDVVGLTSGVAGVSAGGGHTCAVTTAGGVKCWGYNFAGQVGVPVSDDDRVWSVPTPVDVPGVGSNVVSVVAGSQHSCAITTAAGLKCWGSNQNGQLGLGADTYYPDMRVPASPVVGLETGVASVTLGSDDTCAVTTAGAAKCWGSNFLGPLGDGTETERPAPVDVVNLGSGVTQIAAGQFHTCALTVLGGVQCWGDDSAGQLGDGQTVGRPVARGVNGLSAGVAAISSSLNVTCALTLLGEVKCWGPNDSGQLGEGTASAKPQRTAGCVIDFGDQDGDRICDSADPCRGKRKFARAPGAWLAFRRVNTEATPNDDALLLQGRLSLPSGTRFADLDFAREGASLNVVNPGGAKAAFSFPAGAFAGAGTAGWLHSQSGERWSFRDATGSPGLPDRARMIIQDMGADVPSGMVRLHAVVRRMNLPIQEEDLPLQAIVVLGDEAAGAAGECAQTSFQAASCAVAEDGGSVNCRTPQRS